MAKKKTFAELFIASYQLLTILVPICFESTYVEKNTMRKILPKTLDLLIFSMYSLNFSLDDITHIFFVTNQLNISKFFPPQRCRILRSY